MLSDVTNARDKCAYIVVFGSTYVPFRARIAFPACMRLHVCVYVDANRFRILIPLQIDP